MESHLEARLWNDVFVQAESELALPKNSIKGTVLIETILATFEMDEILYELRHHSAGLNCGRRDYIFSFIKKFAGDETVLLPDRAQVTMTTHFMRSYSLLAIKTCHRRNAPAMGGMSAFIPIKSDPVANERALTQVRADKEREATDGHDGTWVAHPGLVPIALEIFNRVMPQPNQISKQLPDYHATAADLLQIPTGSITEAGLRQNVAVGLGYVEAWLRGIGCVPLFNLMEDAATAEISRAQLWQWVHHHAVMEDGVPVTIELVESVIAEELAATRPKVDDARYAAYEQAATLMRKLIASEKFPDFLTVPAYAEVLAGERVRIVSKLATPVHTRNTALVCGAEVAMKNMGKIICPLLFSAILIGALAQRAFREYPSVEYGRSVPLPADWHTPGEWTFTWLMLPSESAGRLSWAIRWRAWQEDFPLSGRRIIPVPTARWRTQSGGLLAWMLVRLSSR